MGDKETMTGIFKFLDRSKRLSRQERETLARNAAAAAKRMKDRGDNVTEVQDIRRRRADQQAA
jgi:hypothetical protein